jgi:glutamate dehydrogenase/leucine dehydrogenase
MVTEPVSKAHEQSVMGNAFEFKRSAHSEAESAADENKGNIFKGMRIAFAKFVGPKDGGVV